MGQSEKSFQKKKMDIASYLYLRGFFIACVVENPYYKSRRKHQVLWNWLFVFLCELVFISFLFFYFSCNTQ